MKALSIRQPWASWIASGKKYIETRTWTTSYRGPILICSSKTWDDAVGVFDEAARALVYGHAIAIAQLVDCRPMTEADQHDACCFYMLGRYAWVLRDVHRIERPFPVRGMPGLFDVELPNGLTIQAGEPAVDEVEA